MTIAWADDPTDRTNVTLAIWSDLQHLFRLCDGCQDLLGYVLNVFVSALPGE